jgi:uncharacterized protein YndB with AHSA1/START domain
MTNEAASIDPIVVANIEREPAEATLSTVDGRFVLRMRRLLGHDVERVWAKLTEPEELRKWSPIVSDRALSSPGPAAARESPDDPPVDVEVLTSDRPRELVHRWGDDVIRWTLTQTADGCLLTLEQTFSERSMCGSYGAGWHICLAVLTAVLDGEAVERVVGARATDYGWRELESRYRGVFDGGGDD